MPQGKSTKSRPVLRRVLQASFIVLLGAAACREVDPSGGGFDRMFADRDPVPAAVDEGYDAFIGACQARDAAGVWRLMTPKMQQEVDAVARDHATGGSLAQLQAQFDYTGPRSAFDGTALLKGLLKSDNERSPCPVAGLWRRVDAGPDGPDYVVVAERADGQRQALRFSKIAGGWGLSDLSIPRSDL